MDDSKYYQRRRPWPENDLPPKLTKCEKGFLVIGFIAVIISGSHILYELCSAYFSEASKCPQCLYVSLPGFVLGLVTIFFAIHEIRLHRVRREDKSEIRAYIQEACLAQCNSQHAPEKHAPGKHTPGKTEELGREISRLECLGPECWTEFQVLPLKSLLTHFWETKDLEAQLRSSLAELKEYAEGEAFSYDVRLYYDWERRVRTLVGDHENVYTKLRCSTSSNPEDEEKQEKLRIEGCRAYLRSLFEHIADYQFLWAKGSTIVSAIKICGSVAIVAFTAMGLLPVLLCVLTQTDAQPPNLNILDWSLLGIAGALASALLSLKNTQEIEVGDTSGKRELWRMVLGVPLGMLAGILTFAAISSGLLKVGTIPNECLAHASTGRSSIYLDVLLAVVAGLSLENVFQRVRRTVPF